FGEQVRHVDDRPADTCNRLGGAFDEEDREQARVEAAGSDDGRVEVADDLGYTRMDGRRRLEPEALDGPSARLSCVNFYFPARLKPVGVLGAERRTLDRDRPDV